MKEIAISLTEAMPADRWQQEQESRGQSGRKKGFHVTRGSDLGRQQVLLGDPPGCGSADPAFLSF